MIQYTLRRILALIPVLLVVGVVVFFLIHLTPGDPARIILGESATAAQVDRLREELGLNDPLPLQFLAWMGDVVRGDLGVSAYSGESVLGIILGRLGPTISLTLLATSMSLVIALSSAMLAVWKRNSILDPAIMSVSLMGISIPNFWLALILILLLAVTFQIFPVSGYVPLGEGFLPWLSHLILPAFVLAVQQAALIARMLRDGMLDAVGQDYIRTAWSKGLRERAVLVKHAFRNAMIPTTTVIGASFATLLGGAVVTEQIFVIPGLGQLVVESISRRDFPVLQGTVLFIAAVYVVVNLVVDLLYGAIDPRIRYE